jgi:hypothetical protein
MSKISELVGQHIITHGYHLTNVDSDEKRNTIVALEQECNGNMNSVYNENNVSWLNRNETMLSNVSACTQIKIEIPLTSHECLTDDPMATLEHCIETTQNASSAVSNDPACTQIKIEIPLMSHECPTFDPKATLEHCILMEACSADENLFSSDLKKESDEHVNDWDLDWIRIKLGNYTVCALTEIVSHQ